MTCGVAVACLAGAAWTTGGCGRGAGFGGAAGAAGLACAVFGSAGFGGAECGGECLGLCFLAERLSAW